MKSCAPSHPEYEPSIVQCIQTVCATHLMAADRPYSHIAYSYIFSILLLVIIINLLLCLIYELNFRAGIEGLPRKHRVQTPLPQKIKLNFIIVCMNRGNSIEFIEFATIL
jgi:hypothetical protein